MRRSIIVERKGAWEAGWGRERVALVKSKIENRPAGGAVAKLSRKCQLIINLADQPTMHDDDNEDTCIYITKL